MISAFSPSAPRRSWRSRITFALIAAFLPALSCGSGPARPDTAPLHLVILQTNDLHGRAYSEPATWIDDRNPPAAGGLAAVAARIEKERREAIAGGDRVLVVDCGDMFEGTPEGDLTRGELVIDAMNAIGYDLAVVGNHDFDQGAGALEKLSKRAKFPFLGANIHSKSGRPSWLRGSVDLPDLGVEILGLLTSQMEHLSLAGTREGLGFEREEEAIDHHRWKPHRVRILLTHAGFEEERRLARSGKIDAILGGHSHSRIAEKIGGVPYLQSGSHGTNIGRMDLWIDRVQGRIVRSEVRLEPVFASDGTDPAVVRIIAGYAGAIDRVMNVEVGDLAQDLRRDSHGRSSPLGNYLCDLMREETGAQIAIHNRTGIRASLRKGRVRLRDIYEVSPFGNTLVTMKLTGDALLAILRHADSHERLFLETSGLEIIYEGGRLGEVLVEGKPLEPKRDYSVVTNSFLAHSGDDHTGFGRGREVRDTAIDFVEMTKRDLAKNSPRRYESAERVRPKNPEENLRPAR